MLTRTSSPKWLRDLKQLGAAAHNPIVRTIRSRGFCVAQDFLPSDACAAFIRHLEELFATRSDKVHHEHTEGTSGDYRVFGAEAGSPLLKQLVADSTWLRTIASSYVGEPVVTHFVLGNKVVHTAGQVCNSGAGWHRDSGRRQFKAIIYLTDVTSSNGPFTIIPDSRRLDMPRRVGARNDHRFDDDTVLDVVSRHKKEIVEVVGPAGTCILADTSHIHRGKDIEAGSRYALTNYYFEDTAHRKAKTQAKWGQYLIKPVA